MRALKDRIGNLSPEVSDARLTFDAVVRGVVYGTVTGDLDGAVEIFVNGLSAGKVNPAPASWAARPRFLLRLPSELLLQAPVVFRARAADGRDLAGSLTLETADDVAAGLRMADGRVALKAGQIVGTLHDVNRDALPLTVRARLRGAIVAQTVVTPDDEPGDMPQGSDSRLADLSFIMPLPADLLDIETATISVRVENMAQELDGAPIFLSASPVDVAARCVALEQRIAMLERKFETVENDLVDTLMRQFRMAIVPRVDAIVGLQRVALERQMIALWRALPANGFEPVTIELPLQAHARPGHVFAGHGFTDTERDGQRALWFDRSAFLSAEIAGADDVMVVVRGIDADDDALAALMLAANDRPLKPVILRDTGSGRSWAAVAMVPRDTIGDDGQVTLRLTRRGLATAGSDRQWYGVREIDLVSAALLRKPQSDLLDGPYLAAGFHGIEPGDRPFRWMQGRGIIVLPVSRDASTSIVIGGRMILTKAAGDTFRVTSERDGVVAGDITIDGQDWRVRIDVAPDGSDLVFLDLSAEAVRSSDEDVRHLSLAVSDMYIAG